MEASVADLAERLAATDVLDELVKKGQQGSIKRARREYDEYARVAGLLHRRRHFSSEQILYRRGRWHAAVSMIAELAGLQFSSEEPDLLELANAISTHPLD